jgi:hypothetical protein
MIPYFLFYFIFILFFFFFWFFYFFILFYIEYLDVIAYYSFSKVDREGELVGGGALFVLSCGETIISLCSFQKCHAIVGLNIYIYIYTYKFLFVLLNLIYIFICFIKPDIHVI